MPPVVLDEVGMSVPSRDDGSAEHGAGRGPLIGLGYTVVARRSNAPLPAGCVSRRLRNQYVGCRRGSPQCGHRLGALTADQNRDIDSVDEAAGITRLETSGASIRVMSTVSKSVTPCRAFHSVTASSISVWAVAPV